jgi:hypothetical protein
VDAPGKRVFSGRCVLAVGETDPFRRRWEYRRPILAETLAERGRPAYTGAGSGESKRKSRPKAFAVALTTTGVVKGTAAHAS